MRLCKSLIAIFLALISNCISAQDTLWIVRGEWTHIPDSVQAIRFNSSADWSGINATLSRASDESTSLVVVNTDSLSHTWKLHVDEEEEWAIEAFDTLTFEIPALPIGTYLFGLTDEIGRVLGASGQLQVGLGVEFPLFHWNLGDWSVQRMASANMGVPVAWEEPYVPEQFTINERTYPATVDDPEALVAMNLGDTCWISIANHGFMDHVFHFHGFHFSMHNNSEVRSYNDQILFCFL